MSSTVFLDYDQAELDRQYDQRAWAPNAVEVIERYAAESNEVRARFGSPRTFAYGKTLAETIDVYPADRRASDRVGDSASPNHYCGSNWLEMPIPPISTFDEEISSVEERIRKLMGKVRCPPSSSQPTLRPQSSWYTMASGDRNS